MTAPGQLQLDSNDFLIRNFPCKSIRDYWDKLRGNQREGLGGCSDLVVDNTFYNHDLVAGDIESEIKDKDKTKRGEDEKTFGYVQF